MSGEDIPIGTLASQLGGLTLEELRNGPDLASERASYPALEYPEVPPLPVLEDGTQEEKLCYVLGWLEEEVSKQIMEVAGYRPRNRGEAAYQETYVRGLHYMSRTSHYFHIWTTYGFKPGCEITKALGPDATLEDGGPPLLALCCSVERAYHRRPSKAQFEWFKTVVGTETRWHLIDRSFYIIEEKVGSLWAPQKCCPPLKGNKCHLVDLDAGRWVDDLE